MAVTHTCAVIVSYGYGGGVFRPSAFDAFGSDAATGMVQNDFTLARSFEHKDGACLSLATLAGSGSRVYGFVSSGVGVMACSFLVMTYGLVGMSSDVDGGLANEVNQLLASVFIVGGLVGLSWDM
eukprot:2303940-Ditylum_brightwellii.AAC.1